MHNRAQFWSPVPDWSRVTLDGDSIRVVPVATASVWLVSGQANALLSRHGIDEVIGPRQCCTAPRYALRLAPDRVLFVSEEPAVASFGWSSDGYALSDATGGFVIVDISGEDADELMAQASEYPFTSTTLLAQESARMRFAGLTLLVSRRPQGWRLHIERDWAPALWRWLQAHVVTDSSLRSE